MSEKTRQINTFIQDLGDAARQNPVSAALVGMGVLWLFTRGGTAGRVGDLLNRTGLDRAPAFGRETLDTVRSGVTSAAGAAADTARSSLDAVRERGTAGVDQISDFARDMPTEVFNNARDNLSELFRTQPLALGAIGLAIGAGIAAALPKSELENAYLGEVSDQLKSKAADLAGEQLDTAVTLASDVVDAASAEAQKQGLTMDGAREAVSDIKGKVSRIAEAAKQAATESVR
jgi:hypothetical protein